MTFAIALVACTLTFTSCEKKIDSPLVGSWLHRTNLYIDNVRYDAITTLTFLDNGTFIYETAKLPDEGTAIREAMVREGSWSVDGDKVTLHWEKQGMRMDGQITYNPDFKKEDELTKWEIKDHNLYLTRYYGTAQEVVEEFSDGSAH